LQERAGFATEHIWRKTEISFVYNRNNLTR